MYQRPHDPDHRVVCPDETTKPLIKETRLRVPAKPGQPARHAYEYERNGTADRFTLFAPLEGWRMAARCWARLWRDIAMRAPMRRFRFAPAIGGMAATDAFRPSANAAGRIFPLTVCAAAEPGRDFMPPRRLDDRGWCDAFETILLHVLDDAATYEGVLACIARLETPETCAPRPPSHRALRTVRAGSQNDPTTALAALLADRRQRAKQIGCWFWTIGGDGMPPAMACF